MTNPPTSLDPARLLAQGAWVRDLAARLVDDPADRDDVVQQAWLAALRRRTPVRNLRGWLTRAIQYAAWQRVRERRRRAAREEQVAVPEEVPAAVTVVQQAELQRRVVHQVLALREPYRTTVLLTFFQGLSAADIARTQGVPAATVRSRLMRGLDQLRERFDADHGGDRRAWCLALVPLADLRSPAVGVAALATGGLLMNLKIWGAVLAVAVAVTSYTLWSDQERPVADPPAAGVAAGVAAGESGEPAPSTAEDPAPVAERREEAAPSAVAEQTGATAPTVEGRVTDHAGVPLERARLALATLGADGRFESVDVTTQSDAEGRFALPLPQEEPPSLYVVADREGYVWESARIRGEDPLELTLRPIATLFGRVTEEETGRAVAGARLQFDPPPPPAAFQAAEPAEPEDFVATDADGFYYYRYVPVGERFLVQLRRDGAQSVSRLITVDGPGEHRHDLLVPATVPVRGLVLDLESGRPVAGVAIHVLTEEVTRTGADGRFQVRAAAGSVALWAQTEESCRTVRTVTVAAGEESPEFLLPFVRSCTLSGTVRDAEGNPREGVAVDVLPARHLPREEVLAVLPDWVPTDTRIEGRNMAERTRTGPDGRFQVDGLVPLVVESMVALTAPGSDRGMDAARVLFDRPGETRVLDLTLPQTTVVQGRVTLNGEPAAARIDWRAEGILGSGSTDADGRYRMDDVVGGPVELTARLQLGGSLRIDDEEFARTIPAHLTLGRIHEQHFAFELDLEQVSGQVVNSTGECLPDLPLRIQGADGRVLASGNTGADGRFETVLRGGQRARYVVHLEIGPETIIRDLIPGDDELRIETAGLGRFVIHPRDAETGRPVEAVVVAWRRPGGEWVILGPDHSAIRADGSIRLTLPLGAASLRVDGANAGLGVEVVRDLTVLDMDDPVPLEVRLDRRG